LRSSDNEAENEESQPQEKRDRLTTLCVINEAENGRTPTSKIKKRPLNHVAR